MANDSQRPELVPFELRDVEGLENDLEVKGVGSFGAVYEVSLYGLPCIAKSLHSILLGYESRVRAPLKDGQKKSLREKFEDECVLLSKLKHPNIVKFIGVYYGMYTGEMSLIMEKLHTDLGNYVEKNLNIPDSIKVSLLLDASSGLLYLHSQQPPIIHRDLSAANILVTSDCRAKIADVGVSTKYDTSTVVLEVQAQTVQPGAFAYMPPEALCEHPKYDTKLDIFSFGAVILYVINHKFPEVHEVSYSEIKEGKIQLAKRKTSVRKAEGHSLFPIAAQCLEDNPELRPAAQELNSQLHDIKSQCPRNSWEIEVQAKRNEFTSNLGRHDGSGSQVVEEEQATPHEATPHQITHSEKSQSLSSADTKTLQSLTEQLALFCSTAEKLTPGVSSKSSSTLPKRPGGSKSPLYPDLLDDYTVIGSLPTSTDASSVSTAGDISSLMPQAKQLAELLKVNLDSMKTDSACALNLTANSALIKIAKPEEYCAGDIVLFHPVKLTQSKTTAPVVIHLDRPKPYILLDLSSYNVFNIRPGRIPDLFLGRLSQKPRQERFESVANRDLAADFGETSGVFYRVKAEPISLKFTPQRPTPTSVPPPPLKPRTASTGHHGGAGFVRGLLHKKEYL